MLYHFGVPERRQQLLGRSLEACQRVIGRRLVESSVLQRAADQDMSILARNRITPLGQYHARQKILGTLVENHLPLHRLDRQLQPKRIEQRSTPGTGSEHYAIS